MFESIAIIDNRNGNAENTNCGNYVWRAQFSSPPAFIDTGKLQVFTEICSRSRSGKV